MTYQELTQKLTEKNQQWVYVKLSKRSKSVYRLFPIQIGIDGVLSPYAVGDFSRMWPYDEYGETWAITAKEIEK